VKLIYYIYLFDFGIHVSACQFLGFCFVDEKENFAYLNIIDVLLYLID